MEEDTRSGMRTPVTRWQLLAALVAVSLMVGGSVAWAGVGPTFNDVPAEHPFFDEIEWMAASGITNGFPDGGYHPSEPVTRQAMSAFMQRLYDFQGDLAVAHGDNSVTTSSLTFTPLAGAEATVEIPPGGDGYILATFSAESVCSGAAGYCKLRLTIDDNGDMIFQEMLPAEGGDFAFDSTDSGAEWSSSWESHAVQRYATMSRGCTCTVRVERATSSVSAVFDTDDWLLSVQTDLLPSDESFGP